MGTEGEAACACGDVISPRWPRCEKCGACPGCCAGVCDAVWRATWDAATVVNETSPAPSVTHPVTRSG